MFTQPDLRTRRYLGRPRVPRVQSDETLFSNFHVNQDNRLASRCDAEAANDSRDWNFGGAYGGRRGPRIAVRYQALATRRCIELDAGEVVGPSSAQSEERRFLVLMCRHHDSNGFTRRPDLAWGRQFHPGEDHGLGGTTHKRQSHEHNNCNACDYCQNLLYISVHKIGPMLGAVSVTGICAVIVPFLLDRRRGLECLRSHLDREPQREKVTGAEGVRRIPGSPDSWLRVLSGRLDFELGHRERRDNNASISEMQRCRPRGKVLPFPSEGHGAIDDCYWIDNRHLPAVQGRGADELASVETPCAQESFVAVVEIGGTSASSAAAPLGRDSAAASRSSNSRYSAVVVGSLEQAARATQNSVNADITVFIVFVSTTRRQLARSPDSLEPILIVDL